MQFLGMLTSRNFAELSILMLQIDPENLLFLTAYWHLEGWYHPPKISGTTKGMTMKFLPDVGIHKEARNQEKNLT